MISFIISLVVLVLGYLLYGKFVAHVFGKKPFIITLVPAVFMTVVCSTFLLVSPQALGLGKIGYSGSIVALVVALVLFFVWRRKYQKGIGQ